MWSFFWVFMSVPIPFERQLLYMTIWTPGFILFSYPLAYIAIPQLLLKGKVLQFFLIILAWGVLGLWVDQAYRLYILSPFQEWLAMDHPIGSGPMPTCYLCLTTSAIGPMIIRFFKLLMMKQRAWLQAKREQITSELQLLKAQVHPHFLFNTLNNIYSSSLDNSPQTPGLLLKLSSLLRYMLDDCKNDLVPLEKELEVMEHYIDLEKERYGDKIMIKWKVDGDIKNKKIAPLLILPFLENAFKHGTSEQLENAWLVVEITVQKNVLTCHVANSKDDHGTACAGGIGIANVKKRLECLYPNDHTLSLNDAGHAFVVHMSVAVADEVDHWHLQIVSPVTLKIENAELAV
jgi:two-component system, LytTR family, sensor histidine kinase AlgZ